MKINTEDYEVLELSVGEARAWAGGKQLEIQDDLETALDKAQGDISIGKEDEVFIIIRVRL
jgi:hypothetical protein